MSKKPFQVCTAPEQLAEHLREEILSGRLHGQMPGVHALAAEFGIHRSTVEQSIKLLEKDGFIQSQGAGKRREIKQQPPPQASTTTIALLLDNPDNIKSDFIGDLRQALNQAGHEVVTGGSTIEVYIDSSATNSHSRVWYDGVGFEAVTAIPEPSSTALLGLGELAFLLHRRR